MNDLISRSALIEAIKEISKDSGFYLPIYEGFAHIVEAAPAVDAVPVVRCGECKHIENSPYGRYCTVWHGHNGMGDEGFCNYGERKTK